MKQRLNFSPEPFRTSNSHIMLLWLANLVLIVLFVWSFWHWQQLRDRNASAHASIDHLKERQSDALEEHGNVVQLLEDVDMQIYTKKVRQFHEIQTIFNTHWGRLLDDLAEILPEDVRIQTLRPTFSSGRRGATDQTVLELSGAARHKEAELNLIKALQADPHFNDIRLTSEDYGEENVALTFVLTFVYTQGGKP